MSETTMHETAQVLTLTENRGVWVVTTETSRYLLDLDNLTATRLPGDGGNPVEGLPAPILAPLRKDNEPISILGIVQVQVGHPMMLQLSIRNGCMTHRRTTIVRSIARC